VTIDGILEFIGKLGPGLRQTDIEEIEYRLTQVPVDDAREAEGQIWEAVALIVNDPEYGGDAKVPS
jgi:hypothetical protein